MVIRAVVVLKYLESVLILLKLLVITLDIINS
jgi:hypothetical protein